MCCNPSACNPLLPATVPALTPVQCTGAWRGCIGSAHWGDVMGAPRGHRLHRALTTEPVWGRDGQSDGAGEGAGCEPCHSPKGLLPKAALSALRGVRTYRRVRKGVERCSALKAAVAALASG